MGKIYIVCPECRQQLSFNEVPGYQNMVVECPKCHFKANASVYQSGAMARDAQGVDEQPTQLVMAPASTLDVGQIRVAATNEVQWLKAGTNIIGRRAQTATADIRISNDIYMSRRHVRIDVVKTATGYEHRLVEINSKNVVKLNGREINRGDVLIIKFGDRLTLGKTDIILESNNDESTRLAQ